MKQSSQRKGAIVAAVASLVIISCGYKRQPAANAVADISAASRVKTAHITAAATKPAHSDASPAENDESNDHGKYSGEQGMSVEKRDPKNPKLTLWKLWAKGVQISRPDKNAYGEMTGITARLFHLGKASAVMTAPLATGNTATNQIAASHGVLITSLAPPGTTLKADTAVWDSKSDKITATGHVVYTDSVRGITMRCPKLVSNTALTEVSTYDVDAFIKSKTNRKRK